MNKQVMTKPKVGDKIFSLNVGNSARNCKQVLTPIEVLKVGRKYFTAGDPSRSYTHIQYHLEDWSQKSEYSADSVIYKSQQEYYEEKEARELCREISDKFHYGGCPRNVTLDDLRKIKSIINK